MLHLHRIVHPFDFMFDSTGDILMFGDFYYKEDEPDSEGKYWTIRATTYHQLRQQKQEENWNYSKLNNAESWRDYDKQVKDAYHEMVKESILDHKIAGKSVENEEKELGIFLK